MTGIGTQLQSGSTTSVPLVSPQEQFRGELAGDLGVDSEMPMGSNEGAPQIIHIEYTPVEKTFVVNVDKNIDTSREGAQNILYEIAKLDTKIPIDMVERVKDDSATAQEKRFLAWKENMLVNIRLCKESGVVSEQELVEWLKEWEEVGIDEF